MLTPEQCTTIEDVRAEIDRIDHEIVKLLGQRAKYVQRAAPFKTSVASVRAVDRQAAMMEQRREWAEQYEISPQLIEKLFRLLVDYFVSQELHQWEDTEARKD
jgi:isochorismate pyruvate lyase